jgi:hypothetical protein
MAMFYRGVRRSPNVTTGGDTTYITNIYIEGSYLFTWQTFADGDTTPSVDGGEHFRTANTAPTTITDFDDPANDPDADGQRICVLIKDANTTIQTEANGSNIRLMGDDGVVGLDYDGGLDDILEFVYEGTHWIEKNRDPKS